MRDDFPRIKRLPQYVFNIVTQLKIAARARSEDIIDFGMGNPDQPIPPHIVDRRLQASDRDNMHRYSMSRGHSPVAWGDCSVVQDPVRC